MKRSEKYPKNVIVWLFISVVSFFVLTGCPTGDTLPPYFTINASSEPDEGGHISFSPSNRDTTYEVTTDVQVTAVPNQGWTFDSWGGDLSGSQNPETISMDADKTIQARFVQPYFALTVNTEGEGTVNETLIQSKQTDYKIGSIVELEAIPAEGWEFVEWQNALTGSENPAEITMDTEKTVTAVFEPLEYSVIVNVLGPGSFTVDPDKETYEYGEMITFEAMPDTDIEFLGWFGTFEEFELIVEHIIMGDVDVDVFFSTVVDAFVINTVDIAVVDGLVDMVTLEVTNYLLDDLLLTLITIFDETGVEIGFFEFDEPVLFTPRSVLQAEFGFDFETTDEETFKMWEIMWEFEYKGEVYTKTQKIGEPGSNAKKKLLPMENIRIGKSVFVDIK